MSLDGFIDSARVKRLRLSNPADFDRVDAVRAGCDAILVGAATIRNDDPRLLIRSAERREERIARGRPCDPIKVTVTRRGDLDPAAAFFGTGTSEKLVYTTPSVAPGLQRRLDGLATVVAAGTAVGMDRLGRDLSDRGVQRLMVEGGGTVLTQFLAGDLADELQLVVAPFFVGDSRARRFVDDGAFPWHSDRRALLAEVQQIGDVVLMRYALSPRFDLAATTP